jgi:16S rRNA processing protein RimM
MDKDRKICVGRIAGAHGVRGLVRLRSFTENPSAIADYKPLTTQDGARIALTIKSIAKSFFVAAVGGVSTKDAADALRGTELYVSRSSLPKPSKSEYYTADLIGLTVLGKSGQRFGTVQAFHNYGAGPLLEIGGGKAPSFMLPFNKGFVPTVDLIAGRVIIDPPEDWI